MLTCPPTIYTMYDWGEMGNGLGAAQWCLWEDVNPAPGVYNWDKVYNGLAAVAGQSAVDAYGQVIPKPVMFSIFFALAKYKDASYLFYDGTPEWVYDKAGINQNVGGHRVGHVLEATNGAGTAYRAVLPAYDSPAWRSWASDMIMAFGAAFNVHPTMVATNICPGLDGETQPVKILSGVGIDWWAVMRQQAPAVEKAFGAWCVALPGVYRKAFPTKTVFINNAPNMGLRMPTSAAAVAQDPPVGIANCGAQPGMQGYIGIGNTPGDDGEIVWRRTGSLDPLFRYGDVAPIRLESSHDGEASFRLFTLYMALHCHADVLTLHKPIIEGLPREDLDFARRHLGRKAADAPDVFLVCRDAEYPPVTWTDSRTGVQVGDADIEGDFQYYLTAKHPDTHAPALRGKALRSAPTEPQARWLRNLTKMALVMDPAYAPEATDYQIEIDAYVVPGAALRISWEKDLEGGREERSLTADTSPWCKFTAALPRVGRGNLYGADVVLEATPDTVYLHRVLLRAVAATPPPPTEPAPDITPVLQAVDAVEQAVGIVQTEAETARAAQLALATAVHGLSEQMAALRQQLDDYAAKERG